MVQIKEQTRRRRRPGRRRQKEVPGERRKIIRRVATEPVDEN